MKITMALSLFVASLFMLTSYAAQAAEAPAQVSKSTSNEGFSRMAGEMKVVKDKRAKRLTPEEKFQKLQNEMKTGNTMQATKPAQKENVAKPQKEIQAKHVVRARKLIRRKKLAKSHKGVKPENIVRIRKATQEEEVARLRREAETGDVFAQTTLGVMHATGVGASKDATKAAEWYLKAAVQGDANAQYMLGSMHTTGEGVPKDPARAAYWYRKAAVQGDISAQYKLGMAYSTNVTDAIKANNEGSSRDLDRDLVLAYAWFNLAAAQGNKDARKMRDSLTTSITRAQMTEGQRLASNWKRGDTL